MIRPEDDLFHPRNDDPYWNECAYFTLDIPERKFSGGIYFYHRPNMNLSAGGPFFWDPSGEDMFDCLYWDWNTCQPFADGQEVHDFKLRNSLEVGTLDIQKKYRLRYDNRGCKVDLTWTAIMEPYELNVKRTAAPVPPEGWEQMGDVNAGIWGWLGDEGVGELQTGHYECLGRMEGTIHLKGHETLTVDCWSFRDRTWGPRPMDDPPRAGFLWAVASEDSFFAMAAVSELPLDDDPIDGTTESVVYGFYMKDGIQADIASGTRRVTERGVDGRPLREVYDCTDTLGRQLHAEAEPTNFFKWINYSTEFSWTNAQVVEYDGHRAQGMAFDYMPLHVYSRWLRDRSTNPEGRTSWNAVSSSAIKGTAVV